MRQRSPQSSSDRRSAKAAIVSLWHVFLMFAAIAAGAGCLIMAMRLLTGGSLLGGFSLGFFGVFGFFVLLVLWKIARARLQYVLLRNEERDLTFARKSAGLDGGVIRRDVLTLWTSGPKDWSPLVLAQLEEARRRFAALIGDPAPAEHPLRLFVFADRKWFAEYARAAMLVIPPGLDGFYLRGTPAKIVVGMPNPYLRLAQPDRLLRILFGYYFLNCLHGFLAHSWLHLGVGGLLARDATAGEQARLNRKVLVDLLRAGNPLPAQELFKPNPKIVFRSGWKPGAHAEFTSRNRLIYHAHSIVDFLAGRDAPRERLESFRAFLKDMKRRDKYDPVFRRHFGYGLGQLYNNWRDWVLARGVGDHEPPPDAIREALIDDIIPLVTDPSAKREERIQAIRDMGNAGFTLGADALIDLLRERDREVRTAAAWALEAISGTVGGTDVAHWEDWWDSLPQDAEAITGQDLEVRLFRKES